jgi:leader peptidase (prepilin peptidase) / N-methyltransferase
MFIIYLLIKFEQYLCTNYLRSLYPIELLFYLPLVIIQLNTISYLLLSVLFVLSWMDLRLHAISDRLIILFFCVIALHYFQNPVPIEPISLIILFFLYLIARFTKGFGMGDVYILFGLSFVLNLNDFLFVLRNSFYLGLIIELIKKTKTSFAFIPYIYLSLVLFLILNLY